MQLFYFINEQTGSTGSAKCLSEAFAFVPFLGVYAHVWLHMYPGACWRSEDNLAESILALQYVCPWD